MIKKIQQKRHLASINFHPYLLAYLWQMNNGSYQATFVNPTKSNPYQVIFTRNSNQEARKHFLSLSQNKQILSILGIDKDF